MTDGQIVGWVTAVLLMFLVGLGCGATLVEHGGAYVNKNRVPTTGILISGVSCDNGWRIKSIEVKSGSVTNVICVPK